MVRTKIIAEIGWNWLGDMELAKEMISSAKSCGADFAKFQLWTVDRLKPGPWDQDGRKERYKKAELTRDRAEELSEYCKSIEIRFLVSVFSVFDFLKMPLPNDYIKIPSTEITNMPLLRECKEMFKHVIFSTGATNEEEVKRAAEYLAPNCTIMHCTSIYPCPTECANLDKIQWLRTICPSVGFSDHTRGVTAAIFAIAQGCTFVEKHFTTDNNLPGYDNLMSADPVELKTICDARDEIQVMTSNFQTHYYATENEMREKYRGRWNSGG